MNEEPEVQFHLTKEKAKPSLWNRIGGGALAFAISVAAIGVVVLAYWYFTIPPKPPKNVDFMPPGGGGGERAADNKVNQKRQKQIVPNTNVKRVFAEGAASTFTIPDQGDSFGEMSPLASVAGGGMSGGLGGSGLGKGFGKGSGDGSGMGTGGGMGKLFGLIPETMRKRCSKDDRLQRLKENGGTPACEEAVIKALRFLKKTQNPDGSWNGPSKTAMTGLALLAYFGHCETPASTEFGDSCLKGITYLVNLGMKNGGRMADKFTGNSWCYEHGIATYALGEATTFCKEIKQDVPGLLEVTEKAGQYIIDNQNENGGWAYNYVTEGGHTDSSIVGWQLQALKACSHTTIRFKGMNSCVSKGLEYLGNNQADNGGFGYSGKKSIDPDYFTLTGVGMLCHQMWGKGNASEVRKGAKYVLDNTTFKYNDKSANLYVHYYESQAMMQRGGKEWEKYNELFRDQLLNNQDADGSWKPTGGNKHGEADKVYRTCLCTLMLEVYYRFLSTDRGGARENRGI
jgi:hypothetical protein